LEVTVVSLKKFGGAGTNVAPTMFFSNDEKF
jgi:hypothetical protein